MTGTEVALVMTAGGTLLSSVVSAFMALKNRSISLENGRKLDAVHQSTNGLAARNEAIAKKLGVEEGKAAEKANPS